MTSYLLTILFLLLTIHHSECFIQGYQHPEYIGVPDINHSFLKDKAAPMLNTIYLSICQDKIKTKYSGIIWGLNSRLLVSMPVSLWNCHTSINVIFLIDTGSPISSLTKEAVDALFHFCPKSKRIQRGCHDVKIAGQQITVVAEKTNHFAHLNIIGGDFMSRLNIRLEVNYSEESSLQKVQIQFNKPDDQDL